MLGNLNIGGVNADTLLYSVPAGKRTTFSVNLVNRTSGSVKVRLGVAIGGGAMAVDGSDYLEYDAIIPANTSFERTGLVGLAGQKVYVRTDTLGVSAQLYGIEE